MTVTDLEKILLYEEKPSEYFENIRKTGELEKAYPEINALIGVPQNTDYHKEGDVWIHTMMVLDEAAKRRETVNFLFGFMMSALCHDFGKAVSTTVDEDGTVHSYEHETAGLPIVRAFLERLGADEKLTDYVLNMTRLHMDPNIMARAGSKLKKTNKLYDSALEPFDLIELAVCDGLGKIPKCDDSEEFLLDRLEKYKEIMARPYASLKDLTDAGLELRDDTDEILSYAHKLRLAGVDKESQIRHCISYQKTLQRKNENTKDQI